MYEESQWTKVTKSQWFAKEILGGAEFDYKIDAIQLKMLQMHSTTARQRVTYKCMNSDPTGAVLMSSEFETLETLPNKQQPYSAVKVETFGNCDKASNANRWGEMVFDVKSERSESLPLLDIRLKDVGLSNQEFALSLGEVCFNT